MAINIILRGIISVFAIGIAMVAFMPAVWDLYYNQDLWEDAPAEALATRDNIYATFMALPLFMIGAVFLWAYMSTTWRVYGF
jgi:hypothetical protein